MRTFYHSCHRAQLNLASKSHDYILFFILFLAGSTDNELAPCNFVGGMFVTHSESDDYQKDMELLCGNFGGDWELYNQKDYFNRQKRTVEKLKVRFGDEFDDKMEKVWRTVGINFLHIKTSVKWKSDTALDRCISSEESNTFMSVFERYETEEEKRKQLQFILGRTGEVINSSDAPLDLAMTVFDIVFQIETDEILLEVRKKSEDSPDDIQGKGSFSLGDDPDAAPRLLFAANKKKTMTKVLNDLVKDDDEEDESEYVFMFKGKRLYGFETPMSLQMAHLDIIDAIPLVDYMCKYKCERCICCNSSAHDVEG